MQTGIGFWIIQVPGWALLFYLIVVQCTAAFSYQLGVKMGTQEPAEEITAVGAAVFWAFAFGDLVFYTPLLGIGLLGHVIGANWSPLILGAALGVTIYWPIVCLATVFRARNTPDWNMPKEMQYWVVLPLIALWGLVGLYILWPVS